MTSRGRLVIDAFQFFNELAMLEYRLNILDDIVDYHILIESNKTHAGSEKPLFFKENKGIFEKFKHKIIHIIADDMPIGDDTWARENYQRDVIPVGLRAVPGIHPSDIVIVSDVDEIPNPITIAKLKQDGVAGFRRLVQDLYYFEASESRYQSRWTHAIVSDAETAMSCKSLSKERVYGTHGEIDDGGWHFSYFLPEDLVLTKLKSFAHQENSIQSFANEGHIGQVMLGNTEMFGRARSRGKPSFSLPPGTKELTKRIYELAPLVSDHKRKN